MRRKIGWSFFCNVEGQESLFVFLKLTPLMWTQLLFAMNVEKVWNQMEKSKSWNLLMVEWQTLKRLPKEPQLQWLN